MLIGFSGFAQEFDFAIGTWEGTMSKKKLTIVIEEVKNGVVKGYNILGTNKRFLKGTIKIASGDIGGECGGEGQPYDAVLNEPGDDKWDGVFKIRFLRCPISEPGIDSGSPEMETRVNGTWKANNGKLSGKFNLNKK